MDLHYVFTDVLPDGIDLFISFLKVGTLIISTLGKITTQVFRKSEVCISIPGAMDKNTTWICQVVYLRLITIKI